MSVSKLQAAMLLREALESIENNEAIGGIAGEYTRNALWELVRACESDKERSLDSAAGRALQIKGGRPSKGLGPHDIDRLSICLLVEKQRRSGQKLESAFQAVAKQAGISDWEQVKKIYYKHFDGMAYHPQGRKQ